MDHAKNFQKFLGQANEDARVSIEITPTKPPAVSGYERLQHVLDRAYQQAAQGKGAERHADGKPFHEQPMQQIADRHGLGFILGQAAKKIEEGHGMQMRGMDGPAVREMLGAIVYLAGAVLWIEKNADPVRHEAGRKETHEY